MSHFQRLFPFSRAAMQSLRALSCLLAACAAVPSFAPLCKAQSEEAVTQTALYFAHDFLRTEKRGREVLSYLHFGADYHGHDYLKTLPVSDAAGREIADEFALVYRFRWADDGITDLAFLCDPHGYIYKVQVMYTNAVFNPPFKLANLTIKVLGNALIEAYKDKMSLLQRKIVQKLVDDADAKGLLEWSLQLEQEFGK